MPEQELYRIADESNMIVDDYAFTIREDGFIDILNLDHPDCAMVVSRSGELIETNMDQIEQRIVMDICKKNLQFMEE